MFFLKIDNFLKSKIIIGYVKDYYHIKETKLLSTLTTNNYTNYANNKTYLRTIFCCNKQMFHQKNGSKAQIKVDLSHLLICNNRFSTLAKNSNVFGNFSNIKSESTEMDSAEEEEERFAQDSKTEYIDFCKLIKFYLDRNNLSLALSALNSMKQYKNNEKLYLYRLVISACAEQGKVEQCFKLFKKLRDRGITPTSSLYTSLINACAETNNTEKALEFLSYLKEHFYMKDINLNHIHYAALIKAYSRHKQVLPAFKLADEACDKGIVSSQIYAALFHAAISDLDFGLKYALILWHKMRIYKIQPNLTHYNLLLRAIRDTNFGDLKINDILIPESVDTQIQCTTTGTADLLESPPVISNLLTSTFGTPVTWKNHSSLVDISKESTQPVYLNKILKNNRIILFGGALKILQHMKKDNVQPDSRTLTMLLELLPPTTEMEEEFLKFVTKTYNTIDVGFFNVLIKRRSMRKDYESAKEVLQKMQSYHFTPDIITFGTLAIGCIRHKDGIELLEQMDVIGYSPNHTILETLMLNACNAKNFYYIYDLMKYIMTIEIKPSKNILSTLRNFDKMTSIAIENKDNYNYKVHKQLAADYHNFKIKFENWKEKIRYSNKILK